MFRFDADGRLAEGLLQTGYRGLQTRSCSRCRLPEAISTASIATRLCATTAAARPERVGGGFPERQLDQAAAVLGLLDPLLDVCALAVPALDLGGVPGLAGEQEALAEHDPTRPRARSRSGSCSQPVGV